MDIIETGVFNLSRGPERQRPPREELESKASAALWSAIWEASQFKSPDALRDFCDGVIREVESDAD